MHFCGSVIDQQKDVSFFKDEMSLSAVVQVHLSPLKINARIFVDQQLTHCILVYWFSYKMVPYGKTKILGYTYEILTCIIMCNFWSLFRQTDIY